MDLSALKDTKTTLPGLAMICITILILAGKIPIDLILQNLPWGYIVSAVFGVGGIGLLGVNTNKTAVPAQAQELSTLIAAGQEVLQKLEEAKGASMEPEASSPSSAQPSPVPPAAPAPPANPAA
jgi:hypothetical protein